MVIPNTSFFLIFKLPREYTYRGYLKKTLGILDTEGKKKFTIIIIISCARGDIICPRPLYAGRCGPAAAHPLRLRRPVRLASNCCGRHEY